MAARGRRVAEFGEEDVDRLSALERKELAPFLLEVELRVLEGIDEVDVSGVLLDEPAVEGQELSKQLVALLLGAVRHDEVHCGRVVGDSEGAESRWSESGGNGRRRGGATGGSADRSARAALADRFCTALARLLRMDHAHPAPRHM